MQVDEQQKKSNQKENNKNSGIKLSWLVALFIFIIILIFVYSGLKTKEEEQADNVKFTPKSPEIKTEMVDKAPTLKEAIQMPRLSYPLRADLLKRTLSDKLTDKHKAGLELSIEVYNKDCKSHAFLEAAIVVENIVIENVSKFFEISEGMAYAKVIKLAYDKKLIKEEDKNRLYKINNKRIPKVHVAGTTFEDSINEEFLDRCLAMTNKFAGGFKKENCTIESFVSKV